MAETECPNTHGPDGVIACWSPGGPCPEGQTSCESCGPCAHCLPEFQEHEAMTEALPQFMTIVLLFGAAAQGCNRDEKKALYEARLLLQKKAPLPEVAQAILDARGPDWQIPDETMQAIEALHKED